MPKFSRFLFFFTTIFFVSIDAFSFDWPGFVLHQKNGNDSMTYLGFSVSGGGDINGDSVPDFIIGAPYSNGNVGRAYIYSGATGTLLFQKDGVANSPPFGDNFGYSVAITGDLDGDGKSDFIVGAPNAAPGGRSQAGSIYVYSGASGSFLYQKDGWNGDILGGSLSDIGDLNGDGKTDFIVSAYWADPGGVSEAGSAYVYSGADGTLLYQKDGTRNEHLGFSVAGAGDINGDGKPDFIVGSHVVGAAYIYSGLDGSLLFEKHGATSSDFFGYSVAGAGDINGDGKADYVIGAPYTNSYIGTVYVYSGVDGSLLYQKNGTPEITNFGSAVSSAGDVDGDGRADFIIGAPGTGYGSALVYSGATGSLLHRKDGNALEEVMGYSVAGAGDLNGDGRAEFIVGTPYADPNGLNTAGSAYILTLRKLMIHSISDIPNDQGKQLLLRWKSLPGINDSLMDLFIVYLRLDSNSTYTAQKILTPDVNSLPPGDWAQVAVVAATGDSTYTTIVPTLGDSTAQGTKYSVYFVRGRSINPLLYIDSPIDSGYSIDNLVPSPPTTLIVVGTCQGNNLSYSQPVDADFRYFKIYRDSSSSFSAPVVVGTTIDTSFIDAAPVSKNFYYRVTAVDFSGNEGGPSPQANALAGLKGDLNIDGSLAPADVVTLLNAAFLNSPFPAPFCVADVNCDNNLSPADVVVELNAIFLGTAISCSP